MVVVDTDLSGGTGSEIVHHHNLSSVEGGDKYVCNVLEECGAVDTALVDKASIGIHSLCCNSGNQADLALAPSGGSISHPRTSYNTGVESG